MSSPTGTRLHFEGVLDKAGKRFFEGFRKRWFILDGQYLTYYKASERTEENYLGTIDFSQVKAVNPVKVASNGFQVVTKNRTYTFSAQTPEKLTEWLSVLRQAMQLKTSPGSERKTLSSQDSIDSQYEVVVNRPNRSHSCPSDQSFDSDDLQDGLYSVVEDSHRKSPASQEFVGEYSLVGANTFPRRSASSSEEGKYELVGSRPPSKSDPSTLDMVRAARNPPAGTAPCDSDSGGNENLAFYDLVRAENIQEQKSVSSPSPEDAAARMVHQPAGNVADLYSLPDVSKRSKADKPGTRLVPLSIIAENEEAEAPSPLQTPEETSPPVPPRVEEEPFAIYEIKRILEDAKSENEGEKNEKFAKGDEDADDLPVDESVSAFQQLKEFLQRLDSNEEQ